MTVLNIRIQKYDKYPKLRKFMIESGCKHIRNGKGSHEIWLNKSGRKMSIPRKHVYKRNTLRQIFLMIFDEWSWCQ